MTQDIYKIYYPLVERPSPDEVRAILQHGFDGGWRMNQKENANTCVYAGPLNENEAQWEPVDSAIEDLATHRNGLITIFADDIDFGFGVHDSWSDLPGIGGISLSFQRAQFYEDTAEMTQAVLELTEFVFEVVAPVMAFSYLPFEHEREAEIRENDIEKGILPDVFWLMLLSQQVCDRIGGSRLQDIPVWQTRSLTGGGISTVATADPLDYTRDDKERLRDHLGFNE